LLLNGTQEKKDAAEAFLKKLTITSAAEHSNNCDSVWLLSPVAKPDKKIIDLIASH
jgi:hypothetical protein